LTKVLQKKLAKLLQNNDPAILSQSKLGKSQSQVIFKENWSYNHYLKSNIKYSTNNHEYDDSNENSKQSNFMRRHAGTFIETPISEDIHECSFSLPTSE